MVKLGDVCEMNPSKKELAAVDREVEVSFVPMVDLQANQIHFEVRDTRKLYEVIKGYTYFKNNDVLLAKITPCFENGKSGVVTNLVNGIGFGSTEFIVFRPGEKVLPEWIYYCISNNNFLNAGKNNMTGSAGQQRISQKFIKDYKISIPSVEEQKKIAKTIDTASELIALRKKQLVELDNLVNSTFYDMFGDLVTNEKGWEYIPLSSIIFGELQNGLYKHASYYKENGTPILRIDSFYNGKITKLEELKRVILTEAEKKKYCLSVGDVIINRVNSRQYLGKCGLIDRLLEPTVFESNMMRFRLNDALTSRQYIVHILLSQFVKNQILSRAKDSVNQSSINQQDVKSINIPLPPIALQKRFAEIITKIEEQKNLVQKALDESQYLFESLMSEYFE
jgi:type I restriction enzyme S subunit